MKTKTLKKVMCLMLLALGVLAFQPAAHAVPAIQLFIDDGVNPVINVIDGGALDTNPLPGFVDFSYVPAIGDWSFESATGITYNTLGSVFTPILHFDFLATSVATGGAILVGVKATDFMGSNGWIFDAAVETSGNVWMDALYDSANDGTGPTYTNLINSMSFGTPGGFDSTFGDVPDFAFGVPYALGINALILHEGAGVTSFNAGLTAVPEPATLLLLGFGLLALLGVRRFTH
ncbi:MAG: PEP-CTERM sorting domain-containing protein [Deltaproteobacteria bacterium]|nr:PEP-CTERM sorting domain-containing protein [Deltaproteobacteria bacterium]